MKKNHKTTTKLDRKLKKHCPYEEWLVHSKYWYKTCKTVNFSSFLFCPKFLLIFPKYAKPSPFFLSEFFKSEIVRSLCNFDKKAKSISQRNRTCCHRQLYL